MKLLPILILGTFLPNLAFSEPHTKSEQQQYQQLIRLCNRAGQAAYVATLYLIQYRVKPEDFAEATKEWDIPDEDKAEVIAAYKWVYEQQATNPEAAFTIRAAECMGPRWHRAPGEDPVNEYHQSVPI